jgi:hypothetical protein
MPLFVYLVKVKTTSIKASQKQKHINVFLELGLRVLIEELYRHEPVKEKTAA